MTSELVRDDLEISSNFISVSLAAVVFSIFEKINIDKYDLRKIAEIFHALVADILAVAGNLEISTEILRTLATNEAAISIIRNSPPSEFLEFSRFLENLRFEISSFEKLAKLREKNIQSLEKADLRRGPGIEKSVSAISREISSYEAKIKNAIDAKLLSKPSTPLIQPADSSVDTVIWTESVAARL